MRYERNKRFGRELLTSREVANVLHRKAVQVRDSANEIAGHDTGEYEQSWSIETSVSHSTKGDRNVTQLTNHSLHASAHEWGKGAARPLQRALDSAREEIPE